MRVRVSAVFESGGSILTMKYQYGGQDVYSLPGGGVDKNVPVIEALEKEWKEELGVKIEVGDLIFAGEAHGDKRHPQTIHLIFQAKEVLGTPKIRSDHTTSKAVEWLEIEELKNKALYPDISDDLYIYFKKENKPKIPFIRECMERGYW